MLLAILQSIDSKCEQEIRVVLDTLNISLVGEDALALADGYIILEHLLDHQTQTFLVEQAAQNKVLISFGMGAQTIIECGLLPGLPSFQPCIKLENIAVGANYMRLQPEYHLNTFTQYCSRDQIIAIEDMQLAFDVPPALNLEMKSLGLDLFYGCDARGLITGHSALGWVNKAGHVLSILPNSIDTSALLNIFKGMAHPLVQMTSPFHYQPRS